MSHLNLTSRFRSGWTRLLLGLAIPGLFFMTACGSGGSAASGPAYIPPVMSITPQTPVVTQGQGTLLTILFDKGTGSVDQGIGTVTSGSSVPVTPGADTTYTLTVNDGSGKTQTATAKVTVKSFAGKFVYVANSGGGVSGFALNDSTGTLAEIDGSPFDDMVNALHVVSDPQGKFLFVVNGNGTEPDDSLSVYQINPVTGALTHAGATYIVPTMANPWSSAVDPTGSFVYVRCDGKISAYSLNGLTGALTPLAVPTISTSAGTGDLVIHPSGKFLFCVGRTSSTMEVFTLNPTSGALTILGAPYKLQDGAGPNGVAISNTGEYVFVKAEGTSGKAQVDSSIFGFKLNAVSGVMTSVGAVATGIMGSDAYHGLSANSAQSTIYAAYQNSIEDSAAFSFTPGSTPSLKAVSGSPYAQFSGSGSDCITVSRNGKWAFLTDYQGGRIASASVDPVTGALRPLATAKVGSWPVSVTVVGTIN